MSEIAKYVATGVSLAGNVISQAMANRANMRLADQANQWSIDQWNRENEYNLPINQIKRLREAGINPGLMYGDGGMMNEAAQSPAVTVGQGVRPYIMDPLAMAQVANIEAQTEKTKTESDVMAQKLPEELNNLRKQNQQLDENIVKLNQETVNLRQQLDNMKEDMKLTKEKQITESFNRTMASQQFDELCRRNTAEINRWAQEILESKDRQKMIAASTEDIRAAKNLKVQEYKYLAAANAYRLLGLQLDNRLKEKTGVLYDDQHRLNSLQEKLLGFNVQHGQIQSARDAWYYSSYTQDNWQGVGFRILDHFIETLSRTTDPIKGIISIK